MQRLPRQCVKKCLIPRPKGNLVQLSPQGDVDLSQKIRKGLAVLNCSQGRRIINGRVAYCDWSNA